MTLSLFVAGAAGAAIAVTPGVRGQACLWDAHTAPFGSTVQHEAVYHAPTQRVLLVAWSNMQIWAREDGAWALISDTSGGGTDAAVAYDSARDRIVLFGGYASPFYSGDTREWNGTQWTLLGVPGPSARSGHKMVYDTVRGRTVLFGGRGPGGLLGDTWEWDGQAWRLAAVSGPAARTGASMTFDAARGKTMLYGGTSDSVQRSDLWEWDGSTWTERSSASLPGTSNRWMVYDSSRARVILGRVVTNPQISQTWELEPISGSWTLRDPGHSARSSGVFDPVSGRVIFSDASLNPLATHFAPTLITRPESRAYLVGSLVILGVTAAGAEPISYQWRREGVPLVDGGRISGATTPTLRIEGAEVGDTGKYDVVLQNECGGGTHYAAYIEIRNPGEPCYPNCDESTHAPILNVADFTCFLQRFAAGDLYANCDQSNPPPILNVQDFTCFLQRYAFGCP